MVIDANMYWLPESIFEDEREAEQFLAEIPETYDLKGYTKVNKQGVKQIVIEKPVGYENLNYLQGEYQVQEQLKDMDTAGVDQAILKIPCCQEWMSLAMCKKFNDGMMESSQRSNGRLVPLAVIPPFASKECFEELERCRTLGFQGIQLSDHYGLHYLDSEIFKEFFEKLNERDTTIYIHHTPVPTQYDALYEYNNLRRSYGRCVDQTTAICRELFSGFFDRYPNLKLVHSMLGGGFFAITNMMFPPQPQGKEAIQRFEENEKLRKQFHEHIYFEMSHAQPWGKEQLACAISVLGADHILFGTSYPVRKEWLYQGADFVRQLNIKDEEKDLILFGNAQRLYHIDEFIKSMR